MEHGSWGCVALSLMFGSSDSRLGVAYGEGVVEFVLTGGDAGGGDVMVVTVVVLFFQPNS